VNEASARRPESAVRNLANAIVTEIPLFIRSNPNNMTLPELVESADERSLFEIAGLGEDIEPEIAPDRGRNLRDLACLIRQQCQARGDD
jgi:hypothetical protein